MSVTPTPGTPVPAKSTGWLDVTHPFTQNMVHWPGQPPTSLSRVSSIPEGEASNVSVLHTSLHAGTHMDAPLHFLAEGADITAAPFEAMFGSVRVAHITGSRISKEELEAYEARDGAFEADEKVFFRTDNSSRDWLEAPFREDYVAVEADAARYLADKGLLVVGVDYLSVAPFKNTAETHRILLGAGVWVIEGLDLRAVSEGRYKMVALPLKIKGGDAAPLRVLLREARGLEPPPAQGGEPVADSER